MLFLESPPGAGYSINEDKKYEYNDSRTSSDNLAAIKEWFMLYPEFESNRFWIAGESKAGMYIPSFADKLLRNRAEVLPSGKDLNFYGIIIGNGVMWTQSHWRRKARNSFYSRHSHFGP